MSCAYLGVTCKSGTTTTGHKTIAEMSNENMTSLFDTLNLLQAYEKAVNESLICSITDTKGIIMYVNKKFCDISKYSSAELLGQNHRIINSDFHSKDFFKNMWQTIGNGNIWHDEIKNKAKDKTYYWVDTVIVPIKNESKKTTHYLSLRTLITEKKKLEEKKARYVSSLETLLVMTANKVKKPISNCTKQLSFFDHGKPSSKKELKQIADDLKTSAIELDTFTKELDSFIRGIEK